MKNAWRNGTAPTCTAEVPEFVEKHVHHNYVLTAGVKNLPVHRQLMHVEKPAILRKPPHTVHKALKGGATSSGSANKKIRDRISNHPYKHAVAAIASARRGTDPYDDDISEEEKSSGRHLTPSLFGVAGVIGGAEFDPYQQYRHNIYPFKEQLAHEVNKLVLEKEALDKLRKRAAGVATSRRHYRHHDDVDNDDDDTSGVLESSSCSYDDGSDTDTTDDDEESPMSSPSTLVDEEDDDEIRD